MPWRIGYLEWSEFSVGFVSRGLVFLAEIAVEDHLLGLRPSSFKLVMLSETLVGLHTPRWPCALASWTSLISRVSSLATVDTSCPVVRFPSESFRNSQFCCGGISGSRSLRRLSVSACPFSVPVRKIIVKLSSERNSAHHVCRLLRAFVVVKLVRFL